MSSEPLERLSLYKVTPTQADKLKNYVYMYYDSVTKEPFYIGRGKGKRIFNHVSASHNADLAERLADGSWEVDFLAFGLDENEAKKVEATCIDLIGIDNLLNRNRGTDSRTYGRIGALALMHSLDSEDLDHFPDNLIAVSIKDTYKRYGNDEQALYESTRGIWALNEEKADAAEYILGVVDSHVVYVMSVAACLAAGSTNYFLRDDNGFADSNRYEFVGRTASEEIQARYLGKKLPSNPQGPHYYGPYFGKEYV